MDEQDGLNVSYDPVSAGEVAARLQKIADSIVTGTMVIGALVGISVGGSMGMAATNSGMGALAGVLVMGFIGALLGRNIGENRAVDSRWKAQNLLALVQIEQNTRPVKAVAAGAPAMSRPIPTGAK